MKYKLLTLAMGLCLLETNTSLAAASAEQVEELESSLQKITAQTQELQKEIASLKAELKSVKQEKSQMATNTTAKEVHPEPAAKPEERREPEARPEEVMPNAPPGTIVAENDEEHAVTSEEAQEQARASNPAATEMTPETVSRRREEQNEFYHYLIGQTVTTSPVMNLRSAYDASDLIVYLSSMNEDLKFLQLRQEMEEQLEKDQLPLPSEKRPLVVLSGKVEGQAFQMYPFSQRSPFSDIDLTGAEFDVLAEVSPWALGYLSLDYDNALLNPILNQSGNRINNSRVYLNRGFLTIGNLDKFPMYFSIGQMYVPFGDYTSYLLTTPVTKALGRVNTRAAVLGYSDDGLYLSGYAFNGASNTNPASNEIDTWGANAGYKFTYNDFNSNLGVGFINTMAESQGAQNNGFTFPNFSGFGQTSNTEFLIHKVPGVDGHLSLGKGPFSMYSEYIASTRAYDPADLTFNNQGATPRAFHVEGNYTFKIWEKPSAFTLAYEETWQALGFNLPKNSYVANFNTSIWKNTIESLEFRHDVNYASTDTAGGICDPSVDDTAVPDTFCLVPPVTGHTQNTLLAQIGVYF